MHKNKQNITKISLSAIQDNFSNGIVGFIPEDNFNLDFICSDFAEERFKIYCINIFENLKLALKETFSGVFYILGEKLFERLVYDFISNKLANWPRERYLDNWGLDFLSFIKINYSGLHSKWPYIEEYGQYEWQKLAARTNEDVSDLNFDFSLINEDSIYDVKFVFNSNISFFKSKFPLYDLEDIIKNRSDVSKFCVDVSSKIYYCIIIRPEYTDLSYWIDEKSWRFFYLLHEGFSLGIVLKMIEDEFGSLDESFDYDLALQFLFRNKLVKDLII